MPVYGITTSVSDKEIERRKASGGERGGGAGSGQDNLLICPFMFTYSRREGFPGCFNEP